jgi:hypothetical protein
MSETKFTPGPWYVGDKGIGPVSEEYDQTCGMVMEIAEVWGKNREADEFLIAAAPDMYKALEMMWDTACTNASSRPSKQAFLKAQAALAKARGEG